MIKQQQQQRRRKCLIFARKQDSRTNKSKQQRAPTRTRSHDNTILIVELLDMKAHLLERRKALGRLSGVHHHVWAHVWARVRGVRQRRVLGLEPGVPFGVPVLPLPRSFHSLNPVLCDLDAARARPIASAWVGRTGAGASVGGCWDAFYCCWW